MQLNRHVLQLENKDWIQQLMLEKITIKCGGTNV
jgi:hypothetical protein